MRKIKVCFVIFILLCVLIPLTSGQQSRLNRKKSRSNLQKESNQKDLNGFSVEKDRPKRPDTLKKRRKGSQQRIDYG